MPFSRFQYLLQNGMKLFYHTIVILWGEVSKDRQAWGEYLAVQDFFQLFKFFYIDFSFCQAAFKNLERSAFVRARALGTLALLYTGIEFTGNHAQNNEQEQEKKRAC